MGRRAVRIGLATTSQPRRTKTTNLDHTNTPASVDHATVYVAFELSKVKWVLGEILPGFKKLSRHTITGGDVAALAVRLAEWRKEAALGGDLTLSLVLPTIVVEWSQTGQRRGLLAADAAELGHADDERRCGALADTSDAQHQINRLARSS
jgi:hypothetical protein